MNGSTRRPGHSRRRLRTDRMRRRPEQVRREALERWFREYAERHELGTDPAWVEWARACRQFAETFVRDFGRVRW